MRLDYESKRIGSGRWKKVKLIVGACVSGSAVALGIVIAIFAYRGESFEGFRNGVLLSVGAAVVLYAFVVAMIQHRSHP